ncbi:MAG: cytochrome c biogenesis protein ResB [Nitrospirae bacterium]|nr:cytochrome c biogenesis protein ResB [Nitrospirota bacterium]MCL5238836.1 cytochrome c biogenesis protein ResB [Nitrospirota bacterium]
MIRFRLELFKRVLLSPKTVIALICAVGVFCVIGSTVPQLTERPPRFFEAWKAGSPKVYYVIELLQLNQVFTSVWFLILTALVALSLALSVFYQTKALMKSGKFIRKEITGSSFKDYLSFEAVRNPQLEAGRAGDEIKRIFKDRGYRPYPASEGSGYFAFGKNRTGRWGGVMFHTGLLIVIIAALYGLAFQKRGFVQLIQTDTFQGRDEEWRTKRLGVFAEDFRPGFQVHLDTFAPAYWENGKVRELESSLIITDDKGESREFPLSLRSPIEFRGVKIYQSEYYGYSLGLILEREGKGPVITHFLLDAPDKKGKPFAGRTDFPATAYIFDMKFYPDLTAPSLYATLPGVDLTVTEKGEPRFKGMVLLNQRMLFDNDTLTFAQLHYWTGLYFTANYGMPLVYSGFALSTLGAIMIFAAPYKEVHVKIAEDEGGIRVSMGGRAKTYQAIFSEEFKEMAETIGKVLEKHGNHATA